MPNQDYVLYCYKLPAGSPHMYAMTLSVPWIIGDITPMLFDSVADLQMTIRFLNLTADQQTAAISVAEGSMYILSGLSVPDSVAQMTFGILLHDGDMPDEPNDIVFTRCSAAGDPLRVGVVMNDQIMPAPVVGCFGWHKVAECVKNAGVLTQAQIDAAKAQVEATGTSTQNWNGVSTGVLQCMK